jgi:hypothetical protein
VHPKYEKSRAEASLFSMGAIKVLPAAPIAVLTVPEVAKSFSATTISSPLLRRPPETKAAERIAVPRTKTNWRRLDIAVTSSAGFGNQVPIRRPTLLKGGHHTQVQLREY